MVKYKERYCWKCAEHTTHEYVGSEGDYKGFGLARMILAIGTLGMSETNCRKWYWRCTKCNSIDSTESAEG